MAIHVADGVTSQKVAFYAIGLICVVGSIYQLSELFELYFSYPSTYQVLVRKPSTYRLPAFTLCVRYADLIRPGFDAKSWSNSTVKQISAATLDHQDVFSNCILLAPHSHDFGVVSCSTLLTVKVYHHLSQKCFTFVEKVGKMVEYYEQEVRQAMGFVGFQFDRKYATGYLIFHQARSSPTMQDSFIKLDQSLSSLIVDYAEVETTLLASPYPSNCRNYREIGLFSEIDCLDSCVVQYTIGELNLWPVQVFAPGSIDLKFTDVYNSSHANLAVVATKHCTSMCQQLACKTTYLEITAAKSYAPSKIVRVMLKPAIGVTLKSTELPKFIIVEFICYIGSVLSFWFGSSVLAINGYFVSGCPAGKRCCKGHRSEKCVKEHGSQKWATRHMLNSTDLNHNSNHSAKAALHLFME